MRITQKSWGALFLLRSLQKTKMKTKTHWMGMLILKKACSIIRVFVITAIIKTIIMTRATTIIVIIIMIITKAITTTTIIIMIVIGNKKIIIRNSYIYHFHEVVLLHYREVCGVVCDRNLFFLYKNRSLVLIFLMTCKAIGSPDRFSSSTQPRYETVWYCLICTVPYLILRLISFLIAFLCQTICIWFCLPQNEYLVCYRQTNCKHSKNCCWVLFQLLWHLCAGTLNKSHLRKGTIHSLQPEACHLHTVRTIKAPR